MTNEEVIAIIENEKKCVNRANKNDYCNRDCYNCELVKTDTEILTALDMAIKALEQTTWIPCSKRLPEKYTYTLWCASSGYVRSDYFNGEFWEDAKKYCYEIVAWMPLPEPYKGE